MGDAMSYDPALDGKKVSDLEGAELDYWVGRAKGWDWHTEPPKYSSDWSMGGPLIEKYGVSVRPHTITNEVVTSWRAEWTWPMVIDKPAMSGPTPLIAACRAIVASKYGENVGEYVEKTTD